MVHDKGSLSLLRQDVLEIRIHLEIGIRHCVAKQRLLLWRQFSRHATRLVHRAEDVEKIRKTVENAAGIEVAKAEHAAVGAASVVRKDRLESRMALGRGPPLFARVAGNSDHP